nr:MAG TPA: helix-turn-helix domain-containing protein [Caudoviricetes sp.]
MSKAVMLSIRPKWCEKIASGEKTIEVRKTRPKLEKPFKCYIYCTLQGCNEFFRVDLVGDVAKWRRGKWADRKGNVIGEFTCDRIDRLAPANEPYGIYDIDDDYVLQTCLENGALWDYGHGTPLYGWHISDLRIYDQPREFTEFRQSCPNDLYCEDCAMYSNNNGICNNGALPLRRPPQSWCYVEEG